jgi:hypothetical protein
VALGKIVRIAYTLFPYLYPVLPDSGACAAHIALLNGFGNGKLPSLRAKFGSNFSSAAAQQAVMI